jgi:hypothetical protein
MTPLPGSVTILGKNLASLTLAACLKKKGIP